MTLVILVVIIVLAACCTLLKWRRTSKTFYVLAMLFFLVVGCGPAPRWLLDHLQSGYETRPSVVWGSRNAIVLLGAGTERVADHVEPGVFSYPRLTVAVAQYHDCKRTADDCKVVVSGGDASGQGAAEANVYREILMQLNVDAADILAEADSMNTWQNAQFTSALLQRLGADRIVMVSSALHLRRSKLYFSHFGVETTPVRADYLRGAMSILPLSYNVIATDLALHEYIGIARYYVYNWLGWNPARQLPGQA